MKDDLRGWRLGRVVTVVDRGVASDNNLAYLTRVGEHRIAGERLRDGTADVAQVLSRRAGTRASAIQTGLRRTGPAPGQGFRRIRAGSGRSG